MKGLKLTPPVEESAEYRCFLRDRGLSQSPSRSPVWGLLNRLDELERSIDRQSDAARNAPSNIDVRRAEQRIDRLEAEQLRLLEALDEFPPEHVAAITEARLNHPTHRRFT